MARRGGKAASRRSRQKRASRGAAAASRPAGDVTATPAPSMAGAAPTDAFEAADAELRASVPPPGSRPTEAARPAPSVRQRTGELLGSSGPSRLSERAVAEYHYVGRDLRNIGILVLVMAALLAAAAIAVNVLGIGQV